MYVCGSGRTFVRVLVKYYLCLLSLKTIDSATDQVGDTHLWKGHSILGEPQSFFNVTQEKEIKKTISLHFFEGYFTNKAYYFTSLSLH